MTQPASLLFYLRWRYARGKLKPAAPDIVGAVVLWLQENFEFLNIEQETTYSAEAPDHKELVPHEFKVYPKNGSGGGPRVAVLLVWDGLIEFYHSKFEMADPACFDQFHAAVVDYFLKPDEGHHNASGEERSLGS